MRRDHFWHVLLLVVTTVLIRAQSGVSSPRLVSSILPPPRVSIGAAIAEGVQAARSPEEGLFWRWRRDLYAMEPNGPLARLTVVTPYFRVVREAYRRTLAGRPMTETEGRVFLSDFVRASGLVFPLSLVLNPAPHRQMPRPRALVVTDTGGRLLPLQHARWHDGGIVLELLYEAAGATLRSLSLSLSDTARVYLLDLSGME